MGVTRANLNYMKTIFFLLAMFVASLSNGQQLKKLKISELEEYINKSKKPVVVNFWATFCKPCVEELPYFQSLIKQYNGKVDLLLVSLDLPDYYPDKITSFIAAKKIMAPSVWLDESNADVFCPVIDKNWDGTIPASLFVNNSTKYRKFHQGELSEEKLKMELADLIK